MRRWLPFLFALLTASAFAYAPEPKLFSSNSTANNVTVAGSWKTDFVYDGLGRKRIEREFTWNGSTFTPLSETRFLYDGMLVIQERNANNAPQVTYTRGLDLSGSRQGAGGIGGLLARTDSAGSAFYHTDGAGNVTALIDANQHMVARYLYGAYGRQLGQWGELASANRYRFSSKEWHAKSGLYYYGYRFYEPNLQRWVNRDPIGEAGGMNLYGFVGNNPISFSDAFGFCAATLVQEDGSIIDFTDGSLTLPTGEMLLAVANEYDRAADFNRDGFVSSFESWTYRAEGNGLQPSLLGDMFLGGFGAALRGGAYRGMVPVSRWGKAGLEPGDWVMKGRANTWNYLRSCKWQPGWGNRFASPSSGVTHYVPRTSLQWPGGWGIDGTWKGFFGQRIYRP